MPLQLIFCSEEQLWVARGEDKIQFMYHIAHRPTAHPQPSINLILKEEDI